MRRGREVRVGVRLERVDIVGVPCLRGLCSWELIHSALRASRCFQNPEDLGHHLVPVPFGLVAWSPADGSAARVPHAKSFPEEKVPFTLSLALRECSAPSRPRRSLLVLHQN